MQGYARMGRSKIQRIGLGLLIAGGVLLAGSLMTGWTFLLIWGLQKPVERRGVLLLTAFPVIFGLFLTTLNGISNGNLFLTWALIKLSVLMVAMVSGYRLAGKLVNRA